MQVFFFYNKKTNICIPTLSEVLILSEFYNINLNIELKPNIGFEKENVNAIINVLKTSNFNKKYYFSSFDLNSLVIMKENLPSCRCGLLIDKFKIVGRINNYSIIMLNSYIILDNLSHLFELKKLLN